MECKVGTFAAYCCQQTGIPPSVCRSSLAADAIIGGLISGFDPVLSEEYDSAFQKRDIENNDQDEMETSLIKRANYPLQKRALPAPVYGNGQGCFQLGELLPSDPERVWVFYSDVDYGNSPTTTTTYTTVTSYSANRYALNWAIPVTTACDGARWPQPCLHYSSVAVWYSDLATVTCPLAPRGSATAPSIWRNQHKTDWSKVWISPSYTFNGVVTDFNGQVDEWPPNAYVLLPMHIVRNSKG
jgi:hypothetical protein